MADRQRSLAAACALAIAFSVSCLAPRAYAQDSESSLTHQIGWELSTGNYRSALADARQAVAEFPNSAVLMHLLAAAESKNGLQDDARKSFRKAIRLDPTILQNYYDLALLDMQAEDYNEATEMLKTFLGATPQNAKAHLMLGIAYSKQNNVPLAIEQLKKALAISPKLPLAHYNLGNIYASQGNNMAALDEYKTELGVNPDFYGVYVSAGYSEIGVKQYDAAEALFRRATKIKPLAYEAYFGLARVYLIQNQLPEAESELEMVIDLAPEDIEAHSMLADVYIKLGKTLEANREELVVETLKNQAKQAEASPAPSHQ